MAKRKISIEAAFYKDLEKLQKKYPMVYIENWTPVDFATDAEGNEPERVDWNDPLWRDVALRLRQELDASYGTNWDRIQQAVKDCS